MREIPLPIVRFSQAAMVLILLAGLALRQPLLTTVLLAILLAGLVLGPRANVLFLLGRVVQARRLNGAPGEARELVRFNQSIAATLLALAQVSFFGLHLPLLGWALALLVVAAAGLALTGHCLGCFLYYQIRLYRNRRQGVRPT